MMRPIMQTTTRLIAGTCSAILLSGCAWFGYGGSQNHQFNNSARYKNSSTQYNMGSGQKALTRCQITSPTQAIPPGCRPEEVTLALGGTQNYGQQGQYTSSAYGSHVGAAQNVQAKSAPTQRFKRPLLRGQFGLTLDPSIGGELFDPSGSPSVAAYNRALYEEGVLTGSSAVGQTQSTRYYSAAERISAPDISFSDVYTAPLQITGGLELILGKHATVFAKAGYTRAEGKSGGGVQIIDTLLRDVTTQDYDTNTGLPIGGPVGPVTTFIPNETVATFNYEFSELERYDLEAGGRYYFNPILQSQLQRPLTPFISASGGMSYYNATRVNENQRQRFLGRAFDGTQNNPDGDFYDVNFGSRVQIYDAQWVPFGAAKVGLEWQMTPKTALAFEAGIKYEAARDFSDGTQGDNVISVPLTIRGSYNF